MLEPVGIAVGGSEGKCISVVGVFHVFFFFLFLCGDPAIHQSFKTVTKIVIFITNCKGIGCFCLRALLYLKLRHDWIRRTLRFSTFLRRIFRLCGQTKAFVVSALPSLPAAYVLYLM